MRSFLLILLVVLPVWGMGQDRKIALRKVRVTQKMKMLPKEKISKKIKTENGWNGRTPSTPNYEEIIPVFVIDGIVMDENYDINTLSADIESFSILKDEPAGLDSKNPTILITTKKKKEYETIVIAPGYESFLATQKSKQFYSETYLKTKNILMVNEWNYRCSNPRQYNPSIYEASIDYDAKTEYGIDVEYELYMFFRFMEKQNRMSLTGDRIVVDL